MQAATDSGEPPQLGAGQIKFWPLGAAFYLNYHLGKLGVFLKTCQRGITASPDFLSKCFASNGLKPTLANQQLRLQVP